MRFFIALNDKNNSEVKSADELQIYIDEVRKQGRGEVWLTQVVGTMRGFERFVYKVLGLSTDREGNSLGILFCGDTAVITFMNNAGDEFIAFREDSDSDKNNRITLIAPNGREEKYNMNQCFRTDDAFDLMNQFYENGRKPISVHWRKTA